MYNEPLIMKFLQVQTAFEPSSQEIFSAYELAFPLDERRDKTQFEALFSNPLTKIFSIKHLGNNIGYLIVWLLEECCYIEHFEVFPAYRNLKLGSSVLQHLTILYPKLVLESEPATLDEMARRRIDFYQRNGFHVLDKFYQQPSYDLGKNELNLWLMGNFETQSISSIVKEIRRKVYLTE